MEVTRDSEREKYQACYAKPNYHLQGARLRRVKDDVNAIPPKASYLDVGCGRGELVDKARSQGVIAHGLELVPELCDGDKIVEGVITDIPFEDGSFMFVSCYDVIEHLPEEQVDQALDELFRVCGDTLFLTTNNKESRLGHLELHLTRKPREWWDEKITERANGAEIVRGTYGNDEWHWQVNLA